MKRGKLIIIDGLDGSGKKTQSLLLIKKLRAAKQPVVFFDFPQYQQFYGQIVARYLKGDFGPLKKIDPYLISLAYALDRATAKDKIKQALNQGKIVLCNRYTCSNLAFQSARFSTLTKQNEYVRWNENLEYQQNKLPKPDLVIFLHLPYKVAQKLVDKKTAKERRYVKGAKRDLHEKNTKFLKKVEQRYLKLAKEKNWQIINCVKNRQILTIPEINNKICEILKTKFNLKLITLTLPQSQARKK